MNKWSGRSDDACFMSPSGLHIVYTQDEVDVVQNLMFYIEAAYKVAVSFRRCSTRCFVLTAIVHVVRGKGLVAFSFCEMTFGEMFVCFVSGLRYVGKRGQDQSGNPGDQRQLYRHGQGKHPPLPSFLGTYVCRVDQTQKIHSEKEEWDYGIGALLSPYFIFKSQMKGICHTET